MVPDATREPTERERAVRAIVLGAVLGAALAVAARAPRLPRRAAPR